MHLVNGQLCSFAYETFGSQCKDLGALCCSPSQSSVVLVMVAMGDWVRMRRSAVHLPVFFYVGAV